MKFLGPAQQEFRSLNKQATYFLNNYWPSWKNYLKPKSYVIPPIFAYKNSEISDQSFENYQDMQRGNKSNQVIKDRISNDAERIVYDAISQLIQDGIRGPFIAIQNLDLRLNATPDINGSLQKIFPHVTWKIVQEKLGVPNTEFDFLLIGPNIGIIAIEVKSSAYTNCRQFYGRSKSLPDDYKYGLSQLDRIHALIYLLEECTGVNLPNKRCVRKVLFTPNLEERRYENWMTSLTKDDQFHVREKTDPILQLFKEDMTNTTKEIKKPALYSALRDMLQKFNPMPCGVYEKFAPILAAMASIIVLKTTSPAIVELKNMSNFSESDTIQQESNRIITQNMLDGKRSKFWRTSQLQAAPKVLREAVRENDKVFFLSQDQQKALNGPNRQFIVGAAGTGKTIVLQAKALELLNRGNSVVVLAPKSYMCQYKNLLDNYEFKNYRICHWTRKAMIATNSLKKCLTSSFLTRHGPLRFITQHVDQEQKKRENKLREAFEWLMNYDHIFIDDSFDEDDWDYYRPKRFCFASLLTMAVAQKMCPEKIVWIAMDPYKGKYEDYAQRNDKRYDRIITESLQDEGNTDLGYPVTKLKEVMRCAENVFKRVFDATSKWRQEVRPILGHKIQGFLPVLITKNYATFDDAQKAMWHELETKYLPDKNVLDKVAIIIHEYSANSYVHQVLLSRCQKFWSMFPHKRLQLEDEDLLSETKPSPKKDLALENWYKVSSLEWPLVVYASCVPVDLTMQSTSYVEYQRYRAMSRATTQIIELNFTYTKHRINKKTTSSDYIKKLQDHFPERK